MGTMLTYDEFEDQVWGQFEESGLDDSEWPEYIDSAVESVMSMEENR